ncbi:usher protein [Haemophilus influenzae HK1212]|uniref:Usher protein n=3 Tax=Haemophilus influenzae HK1212 TaxID=456482 RepID=A0A7G2JXQ5_HAEIF|nr:usher protein [Haemophilus influenzae HK1212]
MKGNDTDLNYSVNLSQSIDKETGKRDNSIYLSLSLPLGDNHSADSSYSRSGNDINQRLGINGSFGERHQWSYGINASRNNQGYRSYDANLAHNNSIGSYRASYSRDSLKNRSTSLGASGAVVAHKHGITLSQPVGESFAIIHAKDAAGAKVESGANVSLDYFGNAVVPYTSPYEINYYFSTKLLDVDGQKVQVMFDIHDPSQVIVRKQDGTFVCYAELDGNKRDAFPMPFVEKTRQERHARRAKLKQEQLDEINVELNPIITIEHQPDFAVLVPKVKQKIPAKPIFHNLTEKEEWEAEQAKLVNE